MHRTSYTFVFLTVLALFSAFVFFYTRPEEAPPLTPEEARVVGREIIDHVLMPDGAVAYRYFGDELPPLLADREELTLRTSSSYTLDHGELPSGERQFELIAFSRETFQKDSRGRWRYIEHATTTVDVWSVRTISQIEHLRSFFIPEAFAVDFFAGSGDGEISASGSNTSANCTSAFNSARGAVSGTAFNGSTSGVVGIFGFAEFEPPFTDICSRTIDRLFLPFDTSSIPSSASISSASLYVYVTAKTNLNNDGNDFVSVVRSSQASHTTLVNADYDNLGTTEGIDSGERKDITSVSTGAYTTFTLNATGRGWIARAGESSNCSSTNGITCLALRVGNDVLNINPSSSSVDNSVTISLSEQSGTSQDPYLSVTYSGGFAPWQFWDF